LRNNVKILEFYIHRFVKMITELIVSIIVVLGSIGLYYWYTGTPPGARLIEQEPPVANGLDDNQAKFMFFYATWCPYCKHAQQPWASIKQFIKNSGYTYGGKTITFEEINAETDKGKSALYSIQAYPTFKIESASKLYEMSGRPNVANFREFLKKALGDEKQTH
jgi:thiol-disulfide isomerase/thioredoxin